LHAPSVRRRCNAIAIGGRKNRGIAFDTAYAATTSANTQGGALSMAEYDERTSIPGLVKGLLDDARDLIREELQLARAEIREEISALGTVAISFGAAALVGLIGVALLSVALGALLAYLLAWPTWAGYGIVALVLLAVAVGLSLYARGRLRDVRAIPNTTETIKENLAWMQNKSVQK